VSGSAAIRTDRGGLKQVGKLLKGPLAVTIPLFAVAMVAGIGISIGLLFILVNDEFSADVTLIVAIALTAAIMAIAGFLSYRDYQNPSSGSTQTTTPQGRSGGGAPAEARTSATTPPARGRSRSNARRKSR
jgi:hypothetical protein